MPKTKFQDFIFTVIMVVVMVYAMVCYNIAIDMGSMQNNVFLIALKELPIMCCVAFVFEFFFVSKAVQKTAFKLIDPSKTKPFVITLLISTLTVIYMCPIMSFVASVLFNFNGPQNIVSNFLNICVRNFPMALFWQLCYAGPFVRFIFRTIFKKQLND